MVGGSTKTMSTMTIDPTDEALLRLLRDNARLPTAELARLLKLSRTTVQSRLDEGTTVTVTLPLSFTPQPAQPSSNIATLSPAVRSPTQVQTHQVKKSA